MTNISINSALLKIIFLIIKEAIKIILFLVILIKHFSKTFPSLVTLK